MNFSYLLISPDFTRKTHCKMETQKHNKEIFHLRLPLSILHSFTFMNMELYWSRELFYFLMNAMFYTFSYLNSLQNKILLLLFSCQVMSNSLATPWTRAYYSIIIISTTFINTLMSQAFRKNLYMYYVISSYFVPMLYIRILRFPWLTKAPQLVETKLVSGFMSFRVRVHSHHIRNPHL